MKATNKLDTNEMSLSRRKAAQFAAAGGIMSAVGAGLSLQTKAEAQTVSIEIPDTGADLPAEEVTFRVLVQGPGPRSPFYEAFFAAYQDAHPQIEIQFDELPGDQIRQILPISMQDGQAHDIFQYVGAAPLANVVAAGWATPLDDIIPNFESWKSNFPPGVFLEGITVFGGKTYTFPLASNQRYGTLLFYNPQYLAEAGYDPSLNPLTWKEFRAAAKALTEQGDGQYYGVAIGGEAGNLSEIVANLGTTAGAAGSETLGGPMSWLTGEYNFATDEYLAAIELLLGMQDDGSLLPGYISLTEREAETNLTRGTAAMTLDGPWLIARWAKDFPNFQYGIASQPLAEVASFIPIGYPPGGANLHLVSADSELKAVAGDIFAHWGSPRGQAAFQSIVGGTLLAILPEARDEAEVSKQSLQARSLFEEQVRLHPDPRVRNPDVAMVYEEYRVLQPSMGEVVQGLLAGQLSDPKTAMQDLKDRADAELERSIKAAKDNGANVSRDDWVFPNWDPMQDYTEDNYGAIRG